MNDVMYSIPFLRNEGEKKRSLAYHTPRGCSTFSTKKGVGFSVKEEV